jgi:hypothetical protein
MIHCWDSWSCNGFNTLIYACNLILAHMYFMHSSLPSNSGVTVVEMIEAPKRSTAHRSRSTAWNRSIEGRKSRSCARLWRCRRGHRRARDDVVGHRTTKVVDALLMCLRSGRAHGAWRRSAAHACARWLLHSPDLERPHNAKATDGAQRGKPPPVELRQGDLIFCRSRVLADSELFFKQIRKLVLVSMRHGHSRWK